MSDRESRIGFGATCIQVGDEVRIRKGFGQHAKGVINKLGRAPFGYCEVTLTKVGKTRAGWESGDRVSVCNAWLEGSAMI